MPKPRFSPRPSLRRIVQAAAALALAPVTALALNLPNRLTVVDDGSRATLAHGVSGRAKQSVDLGPAPSSRRLEGVTLFFGRTPEQQTALAQLLAAQQTPGSPQYRHWLTPQQFGARFGLSGADMAKVSGWLTSQGLTVTEAPPSNTLIMVSGTVEQLQRAFGTSIHSVSSKGESHIANVTDPVLPGALAKIVTGISGLDDFKLRARVRAGAVLPSSTRPNFTSGVTGKHYLSPGDFQVIYDAKPLLASAINGSGTTIAVMGQTDISLPEVAAFRSAAGLPAQIPMVVLATATAPGSQSKDVLEAQLDVEWAGAAAPNAQIVYVNSTNVFTSLQYAITHDSAPILSISYGNCEPAFDSSFLYSFDSLFQQANAQGQTILTASGDSGATDCDNQSVAAADGLAVDFPASSPNVTAVGGTMFDDTANPGAYWAGGIGSPDQSTSAVSYIPETVWNETAGFGYLGAAGGGASVYFTKPTWQVGNGVPSDLSRDVPDISLAAAALHDPYLYCVPLVSGVTSETACTNGFRSASSGLATVGGTSAGVPSFAGMLALIEQKLGATTGLGNINPILYALGGTSAFHDVTSGGNTVPCIAGAPDCQTASSIGFNAAPGYDLASGWGSIDAFNMANAWATTLPAGLPSTTGAKASLTTLTLPTGAASCGISSGSITVTVQVSESIAFGGTAVGPTPTGSVQLVIDNGAVGTPVTLTNGSATLVADTTNLSSGAHNIEAVYAGSGTYAPSKSYLGATVLQGTPIAPVRIIDVVSSSNPDFSLTPCLPGVTVRTGATSAPVTLSATSVNGFSGKVTFTVSTDAALLADYNFSTSPADVSATTAGTTALTISAFQTNGKSKTGASGMIRRSGSNSAGISRRELLGGGAGAAVLASMLFLVVPRPRRFVSLLALLLSAGGLGMLGCGSGAAPINGGGGTTTPVTTPVPAGTYLVNVTASGSNSAGQALVHTSILTLTVTQ